MFTYIQLIQSLKIYLYNIKVLNNKVLFYYANLTKNKDEAIKYYKMAIEKGNVDAMNNYAILIENENKDEASKYYKMAIEKQYVRSMYNYAILIQNENKDEAIKYYKMAIEKGDIGSMNNYAILIENENKDEAIKYYKMAIEKGSGYAMYNYACIIQNENKDEAIKYYLMAIDKGNTNAMNNYASLIENKNKDEAIKYYFMAIEYGHSGSLKRCLIKDGKLQVYYYLSRCKNTDFILTNIKELEKDKTIFYYKRKLQCMSKVDTCIICFEETTVIPRECCHYYCSACYCKIDKCCMRCDE